MTFRTLVRSYVLSVLVMAKFAVADKLQFVSAGEDQNWTNAANWICTNELKNNVVPGPDDMMGQRHGGTVRITTAVTIGYLQSGRGEVIVDGGSLLAVGLTDFNCTSYKYPGTLIVKNGGSATFNSYFMLGFDGSQGGRIEIHDGAIRVSGSYFHNKDYEGSELLDTRTTIHTGGLLDVDKLSLHSGVMDVAGGTVIIRKVVLEDVNQWIADGRIVAMGGAPGWKIKITQDPATGHAAIVAEESSASSSSVHSTTAGDAVCEKMKPSTMYTLIIGLTAGLLVLFSLSFCLCKKRKKAGPEESGTTYDF